MSSRANSFWAIVSSLRIDNEFFLSRALNKIFSFLSLSLLLAFRVLSEDTRVGVDGIAIELKTITLFGGAFETGGALPSLLRRTSEVSEILWIRCISFVSISVTYAYFRKRPDGWPDVVGVSNRDQDRSVESGNSLGKLERREPFL